ncbi:sensor histidine kinase [Mucilaginibacter calamicampi]|uniref:Sensor histidine kinase n=1 Tax=Mucilaginibacter calamicampi TaxID=1302352 RepID=A0ABW2YVJ9_9SPHI
MENTFDVDKYNKIEFKVVTAIFIFSVLNLVSVAINQNFWEVEEHWSFENAHIQISYLENYFLPLFFRYSTLYGIYLLGHFIIIRQFITNTSVSKHVMFSILIFMATVVIWAWSDLWLKRYLLVPTPYNKHIYRNEIMVRLLGRSLITVWWFFVAYALYNYAKYSAFVVSLITEKIKDSNKVWRDSYWALGIWLFLLLIIKGQAFLFLPVIPVYIYLSLRLIPLVKSQNKGLSNYLSRVTLMALAISGLVIFLYSLHNSHRVNTFALIVLLIAGCYAFIVAPVTWFIYHHRMGRTEITGLKTALGQSSANLDFLRSQINPHFLFNALNTLYGTSIQENAERTGEGIQKLGDMMRFMLHENMQEKISLMREVDYLNNYISLQKLRTHTSPQIVIQTEIEESVNGLQIAPMLLIPFVENAFKHGISLREASHIKIALHTEGLNLFFDVYNSVHPKIGTDPEKNNNGIGLLNVKQRLQLLYPDRHELMIRETTKEFFVHLTLKL